MQTVWGHDQAVAAWLATRVPQCVNGFGPSRGLLIVEDDMKTLAGGVVFHNWDPTADVMEISGAGVTKRWLPRNVLWQVFSYPFIGCGCQMVVMRVSENNRHGDRGIHRILKAYGFKEHRIERLYGRHEDGLVFTLTDDDWRANGFHTKELAAHG